MCAKLTLLGTGGGRHTAMFQARSTGGFLLDAGARIHVDPGPGALTALRSIACNPEETDAVVVSHCHPDHYSDAEVVVEGMCRGGWVRRGELYGPVSVLRGSDGLGPCISAYHRSLPAKTAVIGPGDDLRIAGVRAEVMRADHSDPSNIGLKFHTDGGVLAYVSDTSYSDPIADQYAGSRVLLLPVTTPGRNRIRGHLCTDDARRFVERVRPELAVFVHLGIVMLKAGPEDEAARVEDATGVRTVAGEDLMTVDAAGGLSVGRAEPAAPGWLGFWDI